MRDFKAFVREHLTSVVLPPHRELKVVDEIAAQLEDAYESALARGLSDEEAWRVVQRQVPDWKRIAHDILAAEPAVVRLAQPAPGRMAGESRGSSTAFAISLAWGSCAICTRASGCS